MNMTGTNDALPPIASTTKDLTVIETRREFIQRCLGSLAGITIIGTVAPLLAGCEISELKAPTPSGNEVIFDVSSLTQDNQGLVTSQTGPDGAPILLVRVTAIEYVALSMRCTHEGCTVNAPMADAITCICHGSVYTLTGEVVKGPAPSNLHNYPLTYDATSGKVTVTLT